MFAPGGNWRPRPDWRARLAAAWRAVRERVARVGLVTTILGRRRDEIDRESGDW